VNESLESKAGVQMRMSMNGSVIMHKVQKLYINIAFKMT